MKQCPLSPTRCLADHHSLRSHVPFNKSSLDHGCIYGQNSRSAAVTRRCSDFARPISTPGASHVQVHCELAANRALLISLRLARTIHDYLHSHDYHHFHDYSTVNATEKPCSLSPGRRPSSRTLRDARRERRNQGGRGRDHQYGEGLWDDIVGKPGEKYSLGSSIGFTNSRLSF